MQPFTNIEPELQDTIHELMDAAVQATFDRNESVIDVADYCEYDPYEEAEEATEAPTDQLLGLLLTEPLCNATPHIFLLTGH